MPASSFHTATAAAVAIAVSVSMPASLQAATQGSVGATSTGTTVITAAVPNRVRISAIDDITFDLSGWDGTADVSLSDDLCVWSNSGGYNVTVTGDGGTGGGTAFLLDDGAGDDLAYSVQWNDVAGTDAGAASLTANTTLNGQTGASNGSTCSNGANPTARVIVTLGNSDLQAVPAATYTGVMTMTVAPE